MALDDELRQLFTTDDRLDVPVRGDAEQIIVAGARRVRRRRIVAATASGALGVVVVVVVGIALAGASPDAMPPATANSTTRPAAPVSSSTSPPTHTSATAPAVEPGPEDTTTEKQPKSTPTKPTDAGPPALRFQVVGPTGLRALTLGQTIEEAQATGLLGAKTSDEGDCAVYALAGDDRVSGQVYIATTVRMIEADPVQTPEGVGPGWTIGQVEDVYPALDEADADTGHALVPVPGNAAAGFLFGFADGVVTTVTLQSTDQTCV
ncbi:hypothetical protein [Actinophytocola oryzae]|uniref:Uncharacterized protein n=1 Tax=Actinophytocola oryzae TaxID=502181 RepID=A0A4V3FTD5_9PSEU|nr:hypothetical protein [Actinophytocola oryzae]TDV50931.1 hypothetical protein CLV71_106277 [Actinophytocola oryzae]